MFQIADNRLIQDRIVHYREEDNDDKLTVVISKDWESITLKVRTPDKNFSFVPVHLYYDENDEGINFSIKSKILATEEEMQGFFAQHYDTLVDAVAIAERYRIITELMSTLVDDQKFDLRKKSIDRVEDKDGNKIDTSNMSEEEFENMMIESYLNELDKFEETKKFVKLYSSEEGSQILQATFSAPGPKKNQILLRKNN